MLDFSNIPKINDFSLLKRSSKVLLALAEMIVTWEGLYIYYVPYIQYSARCNRMYDCMTTFSW